MRYATLKHFASPRSFFPDASRWQITHTSLKSLFWFCFVLAPCAASKSASGEFHSKKLEGMREKFPQRKKEKKSPKNLDGHTSNLKEKQNPPWEIVRANKYYSSIILNQPKYLHSKKKNLFEFLNSDSIHPPPHQPGCFAVFAVKCFPVREAPSAGNQNSVAGR